MRDQYSSLRQAVCIAVLCLLAAEAQAGIYTSTSDPNNIPPNSPRPDSPWQALGSSYEVPAYGTFWLGIENKMYFYKKKRLKVVIEYSLAGGLDPQETRGFDLFKKPVPVDEESPVSEPSKTTIRALLGPPQPEWETIKIYNNTNDKMTINNVEAKWKCFLRKNEGKSHLLEASFGSADETVSYTDLYLFPMFSSIDEGVTPTFSAPPASGNWIHSFETDDPNGNTQPYRGIRWMSDGAGLQAEDEYEMTFSVEAWLDGEYRLLAYDQEAGEWDEFWLPIPDVVPSLPVWGIAAFTLLTLTALFSVLRRRGRQVEPPSAEDLKT